MTSFPSPNLMKQMRNVIVVVVLIFFSKLSSQSFSVRVLDSVSKTPVPFASIYFSSNKGIISDENGEFELILKELQREDSIFISSMGFKKLSFSLTQFNDTLVYLPPKPIALDDVILTNKNLTSKEILKKVNENLQADRRI